MHPIAPDFVSVLRLPLAAVFFLLPGWLFCRRFRAPFFALTTFLTSSVILFNSVLLLDLLRVPLSTGSVGLVLGLWCVWPAGSLWRRRQATEHEPPVSTSTFVWPTGWAWMWVLPILGGVFAIMSRALLDPLSGWDNSIRWDYLARLMLTQGSLAHYPPVTAEDFTVYSWCDGIPPLVSVLNFWIYISTGSIAPVLTVLRTVGEIIFIGFIVSRLSQKFWGPTAAWPALGTLSGSCLALWSVAMGQETGLLAVSLGAMILLVEEFKTTRSSRTAMWAGLAAGVGAISRDYGLAFTLLGAVLLLAQRGSAANLAAFLLAVLFSAGPWYGRNWLLTGNPLFPHSLGGLLATNPIHEETLQAIADYCRIGSKYFDARDLPVTLAATAGVLVAAGLVGLARLKSRALALGLGIVLMLGLWWWALPLTAGGWNYAHRVLTPALLLFAVASGWMATIPRRAQAIAALLFLAFAVDAGRRIWFMPQLATTSAWPYTFAERDYWREAEARALDLRIGKIWPSLIRMAGDKFVLVDHPAHHAEIVQAGGHPVAWFSPQVRAMFADDRSFEDILQALRSENIRFVVIDRINPISAHFFKKYPFLVRIMSAYRPSYTVNTLQIYDLDSLKLNAP